MSIPHIHIKAYDLIGYMSTRFSSHVHTNGFKQLYITIGICSYFLLVLTR